MDTHDHGRSLSYTTETTCHVLFDALHPTYQVVVCDLHFHESMKSSRIAIQSCVAIEGPLYAVHFEDSIGHCYDWSFEAHGVDGKRYVLRGHRIEGTVRADEGFLCPNYQARDQALCFADRIETRGTIDPTLWDVVTDHDGLHDLMESWGATEAAHEKEDALFWEASGRPTYVMVRR